MPDFTSSFNPQPLDVGKTMSDILGFKQRQIGLQQAQQNLTTGAIAQGIKRADLQGADRLQAEQQAISTYVSNPANRTKKAADMADDIRQLAPTTGNEFLSRITDYETKQQSLSKAKNDLTKDNQSQVANLVSSFIGDNSVSNADIAKRMDFAAKVNPALSDVVQNYKGLIQFLPPPGPQRDAHINQEVVALGGKSPLKGSLQDTGPGLSQTTTNENTGQITGGPQVLTKGRAPGVAIVGDAYNNQHLVDTQSNTTAPLGTGAPTRGTGKGVNAFTQPVADQDSVLKEISGARKAGDQVGQNSAVNGRIISELNKTSTGPYTQYAHQLAAAAGLPSGAAYQEVGAFLDRQAAQSRAAMGLPDTNAGVETSKSLTGNTSYDNKVIKDKTTFAEAMNQGSAAYRQALDRAVGTGGKPDLTKYQDFRSNWAKNFDPTVFEYEGAIRSGDTARQHEIEKNEGLKGLRELRDKRKALQQLVHGGS